MMFRQYPQALSIQPTDAFVIDRIGEGTMYIEQGAIGASDQVVLLANNYTLIPSDSGTIFLANGSSPITVLVSGTLPVNFAAGFVQYGTGQITVAATLGGILHGSGSQTTQYGPFVSVLVAQNLTGLAAEFVVYGGA